MRSLKREFSIQVFCELRLDQSFNEFGDEGWVRYWTITGFRLAVKIGFLQQRFDDRMFELIWKVPEDRDSLTLMVVVGSRTAARQGLTV